MDLFIYLGFNKLEGVIMKIFKKILEFIKEKDRKRFDSLPSNLI